MSCFPPDAVRLKGNSTQECALSDLVSHAYGFTPAQIALMWQTRRPGWRWIASSTQ